MINATIVIMLLVYIQTTSSQSAQQTRPSETNFLQTTCTTSHAPAPKLEQFYMIKHNTTTRHLHSYLQSSTYRNRRYHIRSTKRLQSFSYMAQESQTINNNNLSHNQCYYCEDHYILHCPATRRYRERLYMDIHHHQGNTSTRTSSIIKTQAVRQHKELITLLGKYPIMQ